LTAERSRRFVAAPRPASATGVDWGDGQSHHGPRTWARRDGLERPEAEKVFAAHAPPSQIRLALKRRREVTE
jgi:hypothetical protein